MFETDGLAWQLSRYDDRVHAFVPSARPASFIEALCDHSVPIDKVTRTHEGARCVRCLLIVGERLADQHRR